MKLEWRSEARFISDDGRWIVQQNGSGPGKCPFELLDMDRLNNGLPHVVFNGNRSACCKKAQELTDEART